MTAVRQVAYTAGRVFTYGSLGVVAGFCGQRLSHIWPAIVNLPAILAVAAGALLVHQGLKAAGVLPKRAIGSSATPCLAGGFFGHFVKRRDTAATFLAGVLTGFLPCGLLYGMLALAMSTHSAAWGGVTMVVFGLGTAPAMIMAGLSGRLIGIATRQWLYAAAAWCLVFTGAISIARGVSFLSTGDQSSGGCPLCRH
jgi:sulfite exporter TauE/SafE